MRTQVLPHPLPRLGGREGVGGVLSVSSERSERLDAYSMAHSAPNVNRYLYSSFTWRDLATDVLIIILICPRFAQVAPGLACAVQ